MSIVIAIIIFSIIIIFHELGHFLLAKANHIRVNEFSLGLGPTLIGFTRGETKYSLKLLPFGGACMMEGEDEESEDARSFQKQSVWARMSVVFAGPLFNFIMAFALAIVVIVIAGYGTSTIGAVADGYSAQKAGLQAGDRITKLNGKNVHLFKELTFYMFVHNGENVKVTYERDGKEHQALLKPTKDEKSGRYVIGVTSSPYEKGNVLDVLRYSFYDVKYYIDTTLTSLKLLVTGGVSVNDLSGPVGIVSSIGQTYQESQKSGVLYVFLNMATMCILLSANLGVMNLLPIPALDGGRLLFMIVEAIRGKRIDPNKEGMVHLVGLALLLGLMVLVMFNDIRKIFF
jgi:regulator of sigma E protease